MSKVFYINTTLPSDVWTKFEFDRPIYAYRIINDSANVVQVSSLGTEESIIDEIYEDETSLVGKEHREEIYCRAISGDADIRLRAW